MVTTQQEQQANIALYRRFLDAMNTVDLKQIDEVISPTFYDHHASFDINNLESYKAALQMAYNGLHMQGELQDIIATGDKVVTRVKLTGKHVGPFLDVAHWQGCFLDNHRDLAHREWEAC